MQEVISSLLFNQHLSDVTIGVGDKIIPAHKLILCARSPVFTAMLTGAMKEATEGHVRFSTDFSVAAVKQLLTHIYTFEVRLEAHTVLEV